MENTHIFPWFSHDFSRQLHFGHRGRGRSPACGSKGLMVVVRQHVSDIEAKGFRWIPQMTQIEDLSNFDIRWFHNDNIWFNIYIYRYIDNTSDILEIIDDESDLTQMAIPDG